ncbi:stressosome-associated protein Prli42 [Domibacillus epiphyticus]|nr:stressosome-associated protein Prli42 [Domibacillus epiphyticus]
MRNKTFQKIIVYLMLFVMLISTVMFGLTMFM